MTYLDKAIRILQQTSDGNDLAPEHLALVEQIVNGWADESVEVAFNELYQNVSSGYRRPWLHGIENLTIDHEGYVRWRGTVVEHYNFPWAYSPGAAVQARKLAERCRQLESQGKKPSVLNVFQD